MSWPPKPKPRGLWADDGNIRPAPPHSPESGPLPPNHANVKRGSRSRAGQSAAEGGRAKRWPERDREPLLHPLEKREGPQTPIPGGYRRLIKTDNTIPAAMANPRTVFAV